MKNSGQMTSCSPWEIVVIAVWPTNFQTEKMDGLFAQIFQDWKASICSIFLSSIFLCGNHQGCNFRPFMHAKIQCSYYHAMHGGWRLYGFPKPYSTCCLLAFSSVFGRVKKHTRKPRRSRAMTYNLWLLRLFWKIEYVWLIFTRGDEEESKLQTEHFEIRFPLLPTVWQRVDKYLWKWNLMTNYKAEKRWEKHLSFWFQICTLDRRRQGLQSLRCGQTRHGRHYDFSTFWRHRLPWA